MSENIKITTRPLCSGFPDSATVDFHSLSDDIDSYDGIFSFSLYYRLEGFQSSKYYTGINTYCQIINTHPFFEKWGMIIYSDTQSYELLKEFLKYPKVIIAITNWTQFVSEENQIEDSVIRCLRFNALESFPNSHILIRDADTIFDGLEEFRAVTRYPNNDLYVKELLDIISSWEAYFIKLWFEEGSVILLGVFIQYLRIWHTEFPFVYPLQKREERNILNTQQNEKNRYYNFQKDTNTKLIFRSPAGVLAGFTNFSNKRPNDLWLYSFDYIQRHYKIFNKEISNKRSWIRDIGKDERILIFVILVKYWHLCYFLTIPYGMPEAFKSYTYLDKGFTQKIKDHNVNEGYYRVKVENENIGKTVNELYREHFHKFADEYLIWLNTIMEKSPETIKKLLNKLTYRSKHTERSNFNILTSANFYEEPTRIPPSTLPPLTVGKATVNTQGGKRTRRNRKNKNKKSRKYTRRN